MMYQSINNQVDVWKIKKNTIAVIVVSFKRGQIEFNKEDIYSSNHKDLWNSCLKEYRRNGVQFMLMLDSTGKSYTRLFTYYKYCYGILKNVLCAKFISGLVIDVREKVSLFHMVKLITDLHYDVKNNKVHMFEREVKGGFSHKDLNKVAGFWFYRTNVSIKKRTPTVKCIKRVHKQVSTQSSKKT